jgi:hypothetical protein
MNNKLSHVHESNGRNEEDIFKRNSVQYSHNRHQNSLDRINKNANDQEDGKSSDAVQNESYSELRNEIIGGNKNDIFNNKEAIKTLYSNHEQRLKALDASIQSIKAKDLYK